MDEGFSLRQFIDERIQVASLKPQLTSLVDFVGGFYSCL
jgi:hypothetical protein